MITDLDIQYIVQEDICTALEINSNRKKFIQWLVYLSWASYTCN